MSTFCTNLYVTLLFKYRKELNGKPNTQCGNELSLIFNVANQRRSFDLQPNKIKTTDQCISKLGSHFYMGTTGKSPS